MAKKKLKKKVKKIIFLLALIIIAGIVIIFISNKIDIFVEQGSSLPKYIDSYVSKKTNKCEIKWVKKDTKNNNYMGYAICGFKFYIAQATIGDTTSPELQNVKDIEISLGEDINLTENITIKDNSNDNLELLVIGDYDLTKEGIYNLTYKACDSYKNCIEEDFKLTVVDSSIIKPKYIDGILIVNKSYPLPEDYVPENLTKLSNGAQVVDYVNDAFDILLEEANSQGLNIYPSTAYRSIAFQKILYDNYVTKDGKDKADTYSARPGYSEHHTGLAIDLNNVNSDFDDTKEAIWLSDNCYKYGFILRYPKGSQEKTGYKYESWHIRYVGKDLAEKLYNNGNWITLEEYFNIKSEYKN